MQKSIIYLILLFVVPAWAQNKVNLKQADQLVGGVKDNDRFDRVIGNVIFTQNRTTIYCDSALFYRSKNIVEAFGNVQIVEGDSVTITALRAEYDGNTRKAKLRNKVVFKKLATATLYTDFLDFDRVKNEAFYFNGGKLVDSINVLTSRKGYYQVSSNMASFKTQVDVVNPDYNMKSDSLQYNSRSKIIYFRTETTVVDKENKSFVYEGGEYNTRTRQSDLMQGQGKSQSYTLTGDKIRLDDIRKYYNVIGNVAITYKKENLTIYGDDAYFDKTKNIAKVFTNAYLTKVTDQGDTLFMTADTLVSIDHVDPAQKRLLAYKNVKIFKKDLQGVADSLEYRQADSILILYKAPILWTSGNQMTADSISMLIEKNTISKIYLVMNAFVISSDTIKNFNQIKGRNMTATIKDEVLHRVYVQGNGESLYFALDDKTNVLMGMNKIICSNIVIRFENSKVNNLSFYVKPEANFIPPHELKVEDTKLPGFNWRIESRPEKDDVVKGKAMVTQPNKNAPKRIQE